MKYADDLMLTAETRSWERIYLTEGPEGLAIERRGRSSKQAKAFSSLLARSVREFFKDEVNRKQFESWYEQKYGTPYQWKPMVWRNR